MNWKRSHQLYPFTVRRERTHTPLTKQHTTHNTTRIQAERMLLSLGSALFKQAPRMKLQRDMWLNWWTGWKRHVCFSHAWRLHLRIFFFSPPLVQDKATINPNNDEGRAVVELYALKMFKKADDADRSGRHDEYVSRATRIFQLTMFSCNAIIPFCNVSGNPIIPINNIFLHCNHSTVLLQNSFMRLRCSWRWPSNLVNFLTM